MRLLDGTRRHGPSLRIPSEASAIWVDRAATLRGVVARANVQRPAAVVIEAVAVTRVGAVPFVPIVRLAV